MGCGASQRGEGKTADPLESDRRRTLDEIRMRFSSLREQLDNSEKKAVEAAEYFYARKAASSSQKQGSVIEVKGSNESLQMIGRLHQMAGMLRKKMLAKDDISKHLQMAGIPAAKLVSEKDFEEFVRISKEKKKLESSLKTANSKLSKATTRRKRMEIMAPTDMNEPIQTPLCRYSNFSISVNEVMVRMFLEQKGPCCAAASVASAINIMFREELQEDGKVPYTQEDVLEYYRTQKPRNERLGGRRFPHIVSPSTSCVGNPLILKALRRFSSSFKSMDKIKTGFWLGVEGKQAAVKLSLSKDAKTQEKRRLNAWGELKNNFPSDQKGLPQKVLLHHTTNHYSLIYGWREWTVEHGTKKGTVVRQCLTATFHQQPKSWMPWDNLCDIIVMSKGFYCIMYIERKKFLQYFLAANALEAISCENESITIHEKVNEHGEGNENGNEEQSTPVENLESK